MSLPCSGSQGVGKWLQDLPDGNFRELQKSGRKQKASLNRTSLRVLYDYRMWALCGVYAYSFGTELALNNVLGISLAQSYLRIASICITCLCTCDY